MYLTHKGIKGTKYVGSSTWNKGKEIYGDASGNKMIMDMPMKYETTNLKPSQVKSNSSSLRERKNVSIDTSKNTEDIPQVNKALERINLEKEKRKQK